MRRLPLYVVLASALTFLVSLYLRWVEQVRAPLGFGGGGVTGLLDLYSGSAGSYDGWGPFGQAAALCALALVAGAGLSLLRPRLEQIWPLASCAGALLFFTVINAAELRGRGRFIGAFDHFHVRLGAGAYLGIASAAVACLAVAVVRRDELARRPSGTALLAAALTLGLLAAFLLPWLRLHIPHFSRGAAAGYQFVDLGDDAVIFPAALACFGLPLWMRGTSAGRRLAVAAGIAVLTAGNLSVLGTHVHWPYEAWMQLGCSLGLLVLALATGRGLRFGEPSVADAAVVFAASLLVASLFLPWQKACAGGACTSTSGWGPGTARRPGGWL